jgi:hypothetical protein
MTVGTFDPPSVCDKCGGAVSPPADGRWRRARGGKVYESVAEAQARVDRLNGADDTKGYEYAVGDHQGQAVVVSRKRVGAPQPG